MSHGHAAADVKRRGHLGAAAAASGCVLLVGSWAALPEHDQVAHLDGWTIVRTPVRPQSVKAAIVQHRPAWLLLGNGVDEAQTRTVLYSARVQQRDVHVAVLGATEDFRRCQRWLRRGCFAYLDESIDMETLVRVLQTVGELKVAVYSLSFARLGRSLTVDLQERLSAREEEVLDLVRRGLSNEDVGRALSIATSTVEFHLHNVYLKLGVRNRVEAVERAISLGLS